MVKSVLHGATFPYFFNSSKFCLCIVPFLRKININYIPKNNKINFLRTYRNKLCIWVHWVTHQSVQTSIGCTENFPPSKSPDFAHMTEFTIKI